MATLADTLQRALDNYGRIWLRLTEVIANPTQANVDALVGQAEATGVVVPQVTQSVDGESYDWTGYQQALGKIMADLRQQIIWAQGPFEVRSRTAF